MWGIFLPLWEARHVMIAVFRRKTVAEVMGAEHGAVPSWAAPVVLCPCRAQPGNACSRAVSVLTAIAHLPTLCAHMMPLQCCHRPAWGVCNDCCAHTAGRWHSSMSSSARCLSQPSCNLDFKRSQESAWQHRLSPATGVRHFGSMSVPDVAPCACSGSHTISPVLQLSWAFRAMARS